MQGSSCKLNVLAEENQFVTPKTLGKLAAMENTCNAFKAVSSSVDR